MAPRFSTWASSRIEQLSNPPVSPSPSRTSLEDHSTSGRSSLARPLSSLWVLLMYRDCRVPAIHKPETIAPPRLLPIIKHQASSIHKFIPRYPCCWTRHGSGPSCENVRLKIPRRFLPPCVGWPSVLWHSHPPPQAYCLFLWPAVPDHPVSYVGSSTTCG